jgi:outer membrane protein OmpA-like peptidoglycan-associated protein
MKRICQLIILFVGAQNLLTAQPFTKVNISNVSVINSTTLDFSPAFHKDGLVFVSNNAVEGKEKMFDKRINQKTMSMFIAKRDLQGELQKPVPFALELVTTVHEGPLTFSNDCKTIYFSRNNNHKQGTAKYVDLIDRMQIYESHLTDKGWSKPKQLEFDREVKDYCHPTLSADNQKLYFSSNRKGGFGGMDLYVSYKQSNGDWGKPINLGASINSNKNEVFPFIHDDGTLYFSSSKEGGIGGLDVYYARTKAMSNIYAVKAANLENQKTNVSREDFEEPLSIGTPFNSEKDDFGFIVDKQKKVGYFTSNRAGGFGEDDIYSFATADELNPTEKERNIILLVLDEKTRLPITKAEIALGMNNLFSNQKLVTDKYGKTTLKLNRTHDYDIKINKESYDLESLALAKDDGREEVIVLMKQPDMTEHDIVLKVLDAKTRLPLSNAVVSIGLNNMFTDGEGKAILKLTRSEEYKIKVDKMSYIGERMTFQKGDTREELEVLMTNNIPNNAPTNAIVTTTQNSNTTTIQNGNSTTIQNGNATTTIQNSSSVTAPNQAPTGTNPVAETEKVTSTTTATPARETNRSDYPYKPSAEVKPTNTEIVKTNTMPVAVEASEMYELKSIYYNFDKANIRSDASRTLDSLITILNKFPDMEIELTAHTDSRGSDRYNDNLSQRRAINAEAYLLKKGILKSRIQHASKGENQLTNECGDDVPCNDKLHQMNRRTEVRIIKKGSAEGKVFDNQK